MINRCLSIKKIKINTSYEYIKEVGTYTICFLVDITKLKRKQY